MPIILLLLIFYCFIIFEAVAAPNFFVS